MLTEAQREALRRDHAVIDMAKFAVHQHLLDNPKTYKVCDLIDEVSNRKQFRATHVAVAIYLLQGDGTMHSRIGGRVSLSMRAMEEVYLGGDR